VDYLRKKSEIDKATVTRRIAPSEDLTRKSVAFLRDYLGTMDIPSDEDGLTNFVIHALEERASRYASLMENEYSRERYPQRETVTAARDLMNDILSQRKDSVALLNRLTQKQDELRDSAEDLEEVEIFFKTQKDIFDAALKLQNDLQNERDYFAADTGTSAKLNEISSILGSAKPYGRIKNLADLMQGVRNAYGELLARKKDEVLGIIARCMEDIHALAGSRDQLNSEVKKADDHFAKKKEEAADASSLILLDAMITQISSFEDAARKRIEGMIQDEPAQDGGTRESDASKKIAAVRRHDIFPARRLQSHEDVERYIGAAREKLYEALEGNDGIQIN
jgi:hypothetical protein